METTMHSTRAISQAVSKYLRATSVAGAGPLRAILPAVALPSRTSVPTEGHSESRSLLPWAPVFSRARILREHLF